MSNELILSVNGVEYTGFINASFSRSLENFCGQFSFQTTVKEDDNSIIQADIRCQDKVEIFIDDIKMLTGFVEDINISYDKGSHSIEISGRDRTGDMIDSSIIKKQYRIRNFKRLIEVVLKDNGYNNIKVFDDIGNLDTINYQPSKSSLIVQDNDTIISFLDRYAKRLQVLMITDSDGDIRIVREGGQIAVGGVTSQIGNPNNNILSANINVTTTERFRFIEIQSQDGGDNLYSDKNQLNQSGQAEDSVIRATRRKILTYDIYSQDVTLKDLAKWNLNIRKARGSRYNCRVQGFYENRNQDFIWQPNTLVQVADDKCKVNGQFLIQGVTFTKSLEGTFTDLSIVNKGAFTTDTAQKISFTPSGSFADSLIRQV